MRYYSTTAGEMVLQLAVSAGDTSVVVDTTAGLPVTFPYVLVLDYGTTNEEVVDVTNASGTTLTVQRGKDGTVAQSHAFGAKVRHSMTARDLRESREHEAATAAHGVTTVAGLTETQTLDNKTFQPTGDNVALRVRTKSANTTPAFEVRDQSNGILAQWLEQSLNFVYGANPVLTILQGGQVNLLKSILELRVSDDINALTGKVTGTPTGRFLRLMSGVTELFSVAANGDLSAKAGSFASVASSGTVTGTNITTLTSGQATNTTNIATNTGAITALDGRLTTAEGKITSVMRATEYRFSDGTTFTYGSTTATPLGARGGAGTFVAPPSGVVTIDCGGQARAGTAGQPASIGFEVRLTDAAGAVAYAYLVDDAAMNANNQWVRCSLTTRVSGLTAGATYYVRQMVASTAAGGDFAQGRVTIQPQL